ncbi:hypothetical protein HDU97_005052 [Phlyctochytrium planicorne]|nr:hypothetical protein HDU97_005052 [Phlyctochytrium planicorne]
MTASKPLPSRSIGEAAPLPANDGATSESNACTSGQQTQSSDIKRVDPQSQLEAKVKDLETKLDEKDKKAEELMKRIAELEKLVEMKDSKIGRLLEEDKWDVTKIKMADELWNAGYENYIAETKIPALAASNMIADNEKTTPLQPQQPPSHAPLDSVTAIPPLPNTLDSLPSSSDLETADLKKRIKDLKASLAEKQADNDQLREQFALKVKRVQELEKKFDERDERVEKLESEVAELGKRCTKKDGAIEERNVRIKALLEENEVANAEVRMRERVTELVKVGGRNYEECLLSVPSLTVAEVAKKNWRDFPISTSNYVSMFRSVAKLSNVPNFVLGIYQLLVNIFALRSGVAAQADQFQNLDEILRTFEMLGKVGSCFQAAGFDVSAPGICVKAGQLPAEAQLKSRPHLLLRDPKTNLLVLTLVQTVNQASTTLSDSIITYKNAYRLYMESLLCLKVLSDKGYKAQEIFAQYFLIVGYNAYNHDFEAWRVENRGPQYALKERLSKCAECSKSTSLCFVCGQLSIPNNTTDPIPKMQFLNGNDLSSSLFEPLGAQQVIFPDLETITQLANNASRKRKGVVAGITPSAIDLGSHPTAATNTSFGGVLKIEDHDDEDDHDHEHHNEDGPPQKRKPGRKLANTVPANKRTAQNRAAQRAFRERKERYLKDLEAKAEELEQLRKAIAAGNVPSVPSVTQNNGSTDVVMAENKSLKERISALESENSVLREMTFSFDFNRAGNNFLLSSLTSSDNGLPSPQTAVSNSSKSASNFFNGNISNILATPSLTATSPAQSIFGNATDAMPGSALLGNNTPSIGSLTPAEQMAKALTASPDDLFAIFDSPFVGLPDDLSFPLPEFAGGGGLSAAAPVAQNKLQPFAAAMQQQTVAQQQQQQQQQLLAFQRQMALQQAQNQQRQIATPNSALLKSTDLDIPVFDMEAFLKGNSPDDLDVFGDPISASAAAAANAAATNALLSTPSPNLGSFGSPNMGAFTALLQQQVAGANNASAGGSYSGANFTGYRNTNSLDSSLRCTEPVPDATLDMLAETPGKVMSEALRQKLQSFNKELPTDLPATCCENQEPDVIDELCEIFKTKAQCSEMQNLQNKILEACNQGDKDRVLDLVDVCKEKKRMYLLRLKAGVSVLPKAN